MDQLSTKNTAAVEVQAGMIHDGKFLMHFGPTELIVEENFRSTLPTTTFQLYEGHYNPFTSHLLVAVVFVSNTLTIP